jgi:hypothetical protein
VKKVKVPTFAAKNAAKMGHPLTSNFKNELTTEGTGEHGVNPLCSDGGCTDVHQVVYFSYNPGDAFLYNPFRTAEKSLQLARRFVGGDT